jgi:hypothetical protein
MSCSVGLGFLTKVIQMAAQLFIGKIIMNSLFFRAAEIGSIECAKILLEYNADIDAVNF